MPESMIQVSLPRKKSGYDILIRPGLFDRIAGLIHREYPVGSFFIIGDDRTAALFGRRLQQQFAVLQRAVVLLDFPAGEKSKNQRVVHSLHSVLLRNGIRRNSLVIALGGGVVGDIAGYVAATILRGVHYVHVPTTLLAQVDSSIGGKVGINHPLGKNLIGAFHQPDAVLIDPKLLKTMSPREFRNGLAEVVKISAALDQPLFALLERNTGSILRRDAGLLSKLIKESVGLKASVVSSDEREDDVRKTLNVGHTIGHAVEVAMRYKIHHGEAVSIGMASETMIAEKMGILSRDDRIRLMNLLHSLKLPTGLPTKMNRRILRASIALDKKNEDGEKKFVLLNGIGKSLIGVSVPEKILTEAVA